MSGHDCTIIGLLPRSTLEDRGGDVVYDNSITVDSNFHDSDDKTFKTSRIDHAKKRVPRYLDLIEAL